jgi:hypothetical protein
MNILELKSDIISGINQLDNESILKQINSILRKQLPDYGLGAIEILGNVDMVELECEANEEITEGNALNEGQFSKWIQEWK